MKVKANQAFPFLVQHVKMVSQNIVIKHDREQAGHSSHQNETLGKRHGCILSQLEAEFGNTYFPAKDGK